MDSGITSGRVLDRELLYTKILEVNLFAFASNQRDILHIYLNQIYSGITCGRVLSGELYTWKLYKMSRRVKYV